MQNDDMPDESEQSAVEKYVLEKDLARPCTNVATVIKYYFVFLTSVFGCSVLLYLFLRFAFPTASNHLQAAVEKKPAAVCAVLFVLCHVIGLLLILKPLAIGFVHLYQHYAPEETRRRCLFKPTCSEYTILAIEKYGFWNGLAKSIERFKRCNGTVYRIDYP
jgi:putative component of membrane protein insertase Oxa1/YidC/SpoIIIJ protein YidD